MHRTFFVVMAIVAAASLSIADDSAKKPSAKPIGIWIREAAGETIWSIEAEEDCITLKGDTAGKIFTMKSPNYSISGDGILHGCIREVKYIEGGEVTSQLKVVFPFAFRLKTDKENLAISDVRIYAASAIAHQGFTGTFQKQAERNADKPAGSGKELKG